jgi:hypothetical protein
MALLLAVSLAVAARADDYGELGPSVVRIHIYGTLLQPDRDTQRTRFDDSATGFIVSPDGLVMSAGHVFPDRSQFAPDQYWSEVFLPVADGTAQMADKNPLQFTVIKAARTPHDVALVRILNPPASLPYLRLCDQFTSAEDIFVLGYEAGDGLLAKTKASVSAPAHADVPLLLQAPLTPGDSGAPVFNHKGEVVAVAIGQKWVNNIRLNDKSNAEIMPIVMKQLQPDAGVLSDVSYKPDCNASLGQESSTGPQIFYQNGPVQLNAEDPQKSMILHFASPSGYAFDSILGLDSLKSASKYVAAAIGPLKLSEDRTSADLSVNADIFKSLENAEKPTATNDDKATLYAGIDTSISSGLKATLKPLKKPTVPIFHIPGPEIRSFFVTRTQDPPKDGAARPSAYEDRLTVPDGYRVSKVVRVLTYSQSHLAAPGLSVGIAPDKAAMVARYAFDAATGDDAGRGWVDAIVLAEIAPATSGFDVYQWPKQ